MARPRQHVPLNVFLNSRLVGRLNRQSTGAIDFRYAPSWLAWEHALPVSLSLPLREERYIGAPVIAVFDNLLPDSEAIRRRVAERVHAEGVDAYSLLSTIGHDCVGALQFLPDGEEPGTAGAVNGKPVDEDEIVHILGNLASAPLGLGEDEDFRISIAGAQEKTALLLWNGRWHKPAGTTATTHILKPQIGRLPNGIDLSYSVENEYLCLKLMAALGIPSAGVDIAEFGGKRVLVVERFDRRWTRNGRLLRLPQEDCCQALSVPPTLKYEAEGGPGIPAILNLLMGSDAPDDDRAMFLGALVTFWLLGATDGHAKNFSVFLYPGQHFHLAPLYDVVSAQPSADAGQLKRKQMKLAMAVGDSRHYVVETIMPRHFLQTAARVGIGASIVERVFEGIRTRAPAAMEEVKQTLPADFPEEIATSILGGFEQRLRRLSTR
ncbi:type II toxin-antitoxin system HipA family toxin [Chelativorans alearense]|uniref:type II toxin-antitoxin system HipA family toxin n=1 Tax=Chelativorans alearense TaxID=2681495 RepID=UPI0013D187E4|nr:type II toxin-antitoxin system HipA family toxin [Chelativorans alearense]